MATSAIYRILPQGARETTEETEEFPVGDRRRWVFTLTISRLSSGGSVQVKLYTSPDGLNEWTMVHDFTSLAEADLTDSPWVKELTLPAGDKYLKASVVAHVGNYYLELLGASPFLDPYSPTDLLLLPKRLREYDDGLVRIVEDAEDDVLQYLDKDVNGILQANLARPDSLDHMRAAVAIQADWQFQKDQLSRSKDKKDAGAAAKMGRYHSAVPDRLAALVPVGEPGPTIWLGR